MAVVPLSLLSSLSSSSSSSKTRRRWVYRLFGPSTRHLRYEAYLAASMALFSISLIRSSSSSSSITLAVIPENQNDGNASVQPNVHTQNQQNRNILMIFLVWNAWMLRYLVLRWLCTWDASTAKAPTFRGWMACLVNSHILGGQTFDQQPSAKYTSTILANNNNAKKAMNKFQFPNVLVYCWQLIKVRLWNPLCERLPIWFVSGVTSTVAAVFVRPSKNSNYRLLRWLGALVDLVEALWNRYVPSLMVWILGTVTVLYAAELIRGLMPETPTGQQDNDAYDATPDRPYGAYTPPVAIPQIFTIRFLLWCFTYNSVLGSFAIYGRLTPPLLDQIAGASAVRDARTERKRNTSNISSSGHISNQQSMLCVERQQSIVHDDRIQLNFDYIVFRLLENLLMLLYSLREVTQDARGKDDGMDLDTINSILNFAGITQPLRDAPFRKPWTIDDLANAMVILWMVVGVAATSVFVLATQALVLDRAYLSTRAYLSSFWIPVEKAEAAKLDKRQVNQWDGRQKYKKNDLVLMNGGKIYRAAVNDPESKPPRRQLWYAQSILAEELGHSTTSNFLANIAAQGQLVVLFSFIILWLALNVGGIRTTGLLEAIAATAIGFLAIADDSLVLKRQTRRLKDLSQEIAAE